MNQWQKIIVGSVAAVCLTAIICCWLLQPMRYEYVQAGSSLMRFDRATGVLDSVRSR